MFPRSLLSKILAVLLPLSIASTVYLYLYPFFHGCEFPLPQRDEVATDFSSSLSQNALFGFLLRHFGNNGAAIEERNQLATFRLLVLADPQLEGDSSLPDPDDEFIPRLREHWRAVRASFRSSSSAWHKPGRVRKIFTSVASASRALVTEDVPRALLAARKTLDLFGNDYYLAHIYRTLHWWSRPTHVTVLGDLIGSQWVSDGEFERRGWRYWNRVFRGGERVGDETTTITESASVDSHAEQQAVVQQMNGPSSWAHTIINVAGNHDIGYAGDISQERLDRFERVFGPANWDVRFGYTYTQATEQKRRESDGFNNTTTAMTMATVEPSLHLINLNSLTLDTPALSPEIQTASYRYINDIITHRSYPVEDRTSFTLLLTHLPLHKSGGICTDSPHFSFHEAADDKGPKGVPRFQAGGLKEQNHLSEYISTTAILQGIFGMSGDRDAPGGGRGRNGLILTGHDHTGCDVVHFIDREGEKKSAAETAVSPDDNSAAQPWKWNAARYRQRQPGEVSSGDGVSTTTAPGANRRTSTPSIREVTLRSMMGEYGGNAGLLSVWFDAHPEVNEWKYEITMCKAGVQHIWWAVHVLAFVTVLVSLFWLVVLALEASAGSCKSEQEDRRGVRRPDKVQKVLGRTDVGKPPRRSTGRQKGKR